MTIGYVNGKLIPSTGSLGYVAGAAVIAGAAAPGADVTGSLAETLEDFTSTISGTASGADVFGTLTETIEDFTLTAAGSSPPTGSVAATLEDFTSTGSGVTDEADGEFFAVLEDFTVTATGTVPPSGTLAVTLDNFIVLAAGNVPGALPTFGQTLWLTDVSDKYKFKRGS